MTDIKHTVISWDCSYRNFFHLLDGIASQNYDLDAVEIIYVEQRTRQVADEYNHRLGLKSLSDRVSEREWRPGFLKALYLNHPVDRPYHLGRSVNKALDVARGDTISVMDGDMLLPGDFLKKLDAYHESGAGIVNLERKSANRPVNAEMSNWIEGIIDYQLCLQECPDGSSEVPRYINNKGTMISAKADAWRAVGGYDEHDLWSTGVSRVGLDVNQRLEIFLRKESTGLPNCFAVHPYHPTGFSRDTLDSVRMLYVQKKLINWSKKNNISCWEDRLDVAEILHQKYKNVFSRMHATNLSDPSKGYFNNGNLLGSSVILGKLYRLWERAL